MTGSIAAACKASNTDHGFRIIIRGRWICAEFTSKDSDFEWHSSVLFPVGGWKMAAVMHESCQSQVTDRLLRKGTDISDCSSICIMM